MFQREPSPTAARISASVSPTTMPISRMLAAEGAEQVREGADAGERERQVEALVRRHADRSRPRAEVEFLVLDRQAAALRVVVSDDALVEEVLRQQVVVEPV